MTKFGNRGNGALFYHRDSSGQHDQTPSKYLEWALADARREKIDFQASPGTIDSMIRNGESVCDNLYLDYDVKGHLLERPALNALLKRVVADKSVSHLYIPLRTSGPS